MISKTHRFKIIPRVETLLNRVKCIDGTILTCYTDEDAVYHIDSNGIYTMISGCRYPVRVGAYYDMSLTVDDPFPTLRKDVCIAVDDSFVKVKDLNFDVLVKLINRCKDTRAEYDGHSELLNKEYAFRAI